MKAGIQRFVIIMFILLIINKITPIYSQIYSYEPSAEKPYGQINPLAPKAVADYAKLIGICDCKSVSRQPDGKWADTVTMQWQFKYIMNGMAVQDESLNEDGTSSGSIRQYQPDSARWYVHYYSNASPGGQLPTWEGGMVDGDILLYNRQAAPNGTAGYYKIRFYEITDAGFNWLGVWTDLTESFEYPTWKIYCLKRKLPAQKD